MGLWIFFGSAAVPLDAQAQTPNTAPPPSSSPPFWARPRPPVQDCKCADSADAAGAAAPASRGISPGGGFVLAITFLLLLVVIWLWQRAVARTAENTRLQRLASLTRTKAVAVAPPADPSKTSTGGEEAFDNQALSQPIELDEPLPEPGTPEARSFFSEAAASLAAALRKNLTRQDLRQKLLEMYFAAGMAAEFINEAQTFLEQNRGMRDESWKEIVRMGHQLLPSHALFREPDGAAIRRKVQFRRSYDRKVDQAALHAAQQDLAQAFDSQIRTENFLTTVRQELARNSREPTPLTLARELEPFNEGARIFLKREDHRRSQDDITLNALGQTLLAKQLGKKTVVTATRDGTHALATASAAARLGLQCVVYIGEAELGSYYARVLTLRKLGAMVRPVRLDGGSRFTDARQYALQAWIEKPVDNLYVSSLTGGPNPYPSIVGELLATIGHEAAEQMKQVAACTPAVIVVNAADSYCGLGMLRAFIDLPEVKLHCVDDLPPDADIDTDKNATPPALIRTRREYAWLRITGRVAFDEGDDSEAMRVVERFHAAGASLTQMTARSLAHACKLARELNPEQCVLALLPNQVEQEPGGSHRDL